MKKFLVCFVVLLFFCFFVNAATYYVSYEDGNDSWSGLTKEQPWKKQPYMNGFDGNYIHQPGDRFIFKGGVVWLNDAFPLLITKGGNSSASDYYGVDKNWFKGSDWGRPVFDLENKVMANNSVSGGQQPIVIWYQNYITLDNFEMKNQRIIEGYQGNSQSAGISINAANNIVLQNFYIHDWVVYTTTDGMFGGITAYFSNNILVDSCVIKGPILIQPDKGSGCGFYANSCTNTTIRYSDISYNTNAIFGIDNVYNNHIHHIMDSFDIAQHENGANLFSGAKFYNNLFHDIYAMPIYLSPGWGGMVNPEPIWIYNNIAYKTIMGSGGFSNAPVSIDPRDSNLNAVMKIYVYNNILVRDSGDLIKSGVNNPGLPPLTLLDVRNNIFISPSATAIELYMSNPPASSLVNNDPSMGQYTVSTLIEQNNKLLNLSQASALGLTSDNFFNVTSTQFVENITNAGQTIICADCTDIDKDILGRDRDNYLPWDIGAYEYGTPQSLEICSAYPGERYSNEEISVQIVKWRSGEIDLREMIKRAKIWKYCGLS